MRERKKSLRVLRRLLLDALSIKISWCDMVMLEDLKRWPHDKDLFSCPLEERPLTATFSPC